MDFINEYRKIKDEIIDIRRNIHKHPELGFEEFNTASLIIDTLNKYNIKFTDKIAGTGIVAKIGCEGEKTLLIRADMDALPISENTFLPYASEYKGKMHACGHDIHVASVLAAAIILKQHESKINGSVIFVFQPAEETTGGAEPMISEGILNNTKVTAAICGHVNAEYDTGTFKVKDGPIMASPDDFMVKFIGKSTHGAQPQNGISPILPACEYVSVVNNTLAKDEYKNNGNILSVCTISSNGGINTIPDEALVLGTFRSFSEESRNNVCRSLKNEAVRVAENHKAQVEFNYNFLYPPLINDRKMTNKFIDIAQKCFGEDSVEILDKPFMTGDDFSYFSRLIPSVYFWYGGKKEEPTSLHSSKFNVNEDAIEISARIFVEFALEYLR